MITKTFTRADIERWQPCIDLDGLVPADWSGTVADILRATHIKREYRLWAALREDCLDAATLIAFGDWCEEQAHAAIRALGGPQPPQIDRESMRRDFVLPMGGAKRWAISAAEWFCSSAANAAALAASGEDCEIGLTFNDTWLWAWEVAWEATMEEEIKKLLEMIEP